MTSPSTSEIWALQDHNLNIPDNRDVSLSYMEMIVFLWGYINVTKSSEDFSSVQ